MVCNNNKNSIPLRVNGWLDVVKQTKLLPPREASRSSCVIACLVLATKLVVDTSLFLLMETVPSYNRVDLMKIWSMGKTHKELILFLK
jgi:hypothetical protein